MTGLHDHGGFTAENATVKVSTIGATVALHVNTLTVAKPWIDFSFALTADQATALAGALCLAVIRLEAEAST